jgi:3-deoxy-D-manno-octulosonic-acid transferase
MLLIYNILATISFVLGLPSLLIMLFRREHRLGERLGLGFKERFAPLKGRKPVWIHAASVGEISAITPLVSVVKARRPELPVVISATTVTGLKKARQVLKEADVFTLLPFDLMFILFYVLGQVRPKVLLLTELELWPNLIWAAEALGCRLAVVNGRLSPRGFSRCRLIRGFVRKILGKIDFFCLQSELDRERFLQLGVSPEKTAVTGSLKFDVSLGKHVKLPFLADRQVIVAGSTREGEEKILIEAFAELRRDFEHLLLVLAPRHLNRVPEVEVLASGAGLTVARKSRLKSADREVDIVVLDTMGELSSVYASAQVAFVGGSLVPVGGHNPLEPAAWGVPVLFGPYMEQQGAAALLEKGAAFQVEQADQLAQTVAQLLKDPSKREAAGSRGKRVVQGRKGTASVTVELLMKNGII